MFALVILGVADIIDSDSPTDMEVDEEGDNDDVPMEDDISLPPPPSPEEVLKESIAPSISISIPKSKPSGRE